MKTHAHHIAEINAAATSGDYFDIGFLYAGETRAQVASGMSDDADRALPTSASRVRSRP